MLIKECYERTIRNCIVPCLYVFVTIQILIGLMAIVASEQFKNLLGRYVPEIEQNEINIKLFLFELFGCNVFLSYMGGLPLLRRLSDAYTSHLSSLLKLWQFFIFTASLNGIFGSYMINGSRKFLKQTIESTLFRGIDFYYTDPEWRLIWDSFQFNEQCCGVASFKDWESLAWMINQDENSSVGSATDLSSLTPYSCCKKDSVCYGNNVHGKSPQNWIELPTTINMTLINEEGCLRIFSKRLDDICMAIFVVVAIVFLLQIAILVAMTVLTHRKAARTKQTSNHQSQTDLPTGTPILPDSMEILSECNQTDDDGFMLQKRTSSHFVLKHNNRKNRVEFASDMGSSEDETQRLLTETTN
ncbi:uncharacterized protein LOC119078670 [Bradysia coprophila]|uniref:uncharacterized protein LOC119078670 n=1 Tax=Bradysia coprophila TaxID=38358 RepID=UPI00187DD93F|nr:uncharacterized protein LOC119078670 [Bradysia coprophila]